MAETKATKNELQNVATSGTGSATGNYTVNQTSWTEVSTDYRVTVTIPSTSATVLAFFSGTYYTAADTSYLRVGVGVDAINPTDGIMPGNNSSDESKRKSFCVPAVFTGLSAGSHTFKAFAFRTTADTTIIGLESGVVVSTLKVIVIP